MKKVIFSLLALLVFQVPNGSSAQSNVNNFGLETVKPQECVEWEKAYGSYMKLRAAGKIYYSDIEKKISCDSANLVLRVEEAGYTLSAGQIREWKLERISLFIMDMEMYGLQIIGNPITN